VSGTSSYQFFKLGVLDSNYLNSCAIAEFWLDGVPVFNYSEAVSFRKKEYDPSQKINRIEDLNVRNLVMSMIQYDRDQRVDCSRVIKDWYVVRMIMSLFEFVF